MLVHAIPCHAIQCHAAGIRSNRSEGIKREKDFSVGVWRQRVVMIVSAQRAKKCQPQT